MAACDYCEVADECAAWCEDETKNKPVGACDFPSSDAYKAYLEFKKVKK